jgi:hypothetical protein
MGQRRFVSWDAGNRIVGDLLSRGDVMKFLELLSKLGILRFGAKAATYRNGAERPTEFMMDDVYNAERDLITKNSSETSQQSGKKTSDTPTRIPRVDGCFGFYWRLNQLSLGT